MSPNTRIVQSDTARQRQAMRDLDALPWAPRDPSVSLSKLMVFGLTPICIFAAVITRFFP